MAYSIDDKLVIAVASSALFDLSESDRVFREHGVEAYREHQRKREHDVLRPGAAFALVRRLLSFNAARMKRNGRWRSSCSPATTRKPG